MAVKFLGVVNGNGGFDYSGVEPAIETAGQYTAQMHRRRRSYRMVSIRWWIPEWQWLWSWL